ncbi:MAG: UvrD-helicase domain-containing protein, partial [Shimia sp.]
GHELLTPDALDALRAARSAFGMHKPSSNAGKLVKCCEGLDLSQPDLRALRPLFERFVGQSGKTEGMPRGDALLAKDDWALVADHEDALHSLGERAAELEDQYDALFAAERTEALHAFAAVFLARYEAKKEAAGFLGFDDLIQKARDLLSVREAAQWVLFRLDGGIDHILVDEAQDTSPAQWDVIRLLAAELAAGQGARDNATRTLFVVGDPKQSIYSFQGADPSAFNRMREEFGQTALDLADGQLAHSFRSAPAILDAVDATFRGQEGALGQASGHIAFHKRRPGKVEVWPLYEPEASADKPAWDDPVDRIAPNDPVCRMSRDIADRVERMIAEGRLPTNDGDRAISPGDILILVQSRGVEFTEVIRALKAKQLPLAGADLLRLHQELGVMDVIALLQALALPEDDLALATALRSPLFGWSEKDLFTLAHARPGYLFQALRESRDLHPETWAILSDLRRAADFERPFELIERILTRHEGRARLIGRLGPEAEEGIDALLSIALSYEPLGVPSLTGFLTWFEADNPEIKRQAEGKGEVIRIMTVHGAKGLEAPIVFLPQSRDRQIRETAPLAKVEGMVHWPPPSKELPNALAALREATKEERENENKRLLYVAMTRAESHLIVTAAGAAKEEGESWHRQVTDGLIALEAKDNGRGLVYAPDNWPADHEETKDTAEPQFPAPLDLVSRPAPSDESAPLSPSDLGGAKVMQGADADEDAMDRGTRIHALLEHLPRAADRDALVAALNAHGELGEAEATIAAHPALFGPSAMAEVGIVAPLKGQAMSGSIDRLWIDGADVWAVDFKTNRIVPDVPEQVPEGLLRQMGAYRAALAQVYPGKTIRTAILWTGTQHLMELPAPLVTAALARALAP